MGSISFKRITPEESRIYSAEPASVSMSATSTPTTTSSIPVRESS